MAGIVLLVLRHNGNRRPCLVQMKISKHCQLGESRLAGWSFVPKRITHAVISIMEQLARALRVLADARELAVTIAWTALVWGSIIVSNLLMLRAFGLPFGISEAMFVLGWSLVGSLVPTPGGAAGAFHAATAAGLDFSGYRSRDSGSNFNSDAFDRFRPCCGFWIFLFCAW